MGVFRQKKVNSENEWRKLEDEMYSYVFADQLPDRKTMIINISENAMFISECGGLGAGIDLQLVKDIAEMSFYCSFTYE